MPATEQTWRNLKILHVAFAVAALVLLAATVMMLVADHDRPWKKYARGFRELETWAAESRVAQQDLAAYRAEGVEFEKALAEARRAPLDQALADEFVTLAGNQEADREAAGFLAADIEKLVELRAEAERLGEGNPAEIKQLADRRFALRGDLLERMRDIAKRAKFREDLLAGALKLRKAEFDKNRADYELAVSDEAPAEKQATLLAVADSKRDEVTAATLAFQEANTYRKSLESLVGGILAAEDAAAKDVADHRTKLGLLQKTLEQRKSNIAKTALELPVLDAFNGPIKVEQVWLPQLTLNNNFRDVARFDRCVTCHRGMDKSRPGSPQDPAYPGEETLDVVLATPEIVQADDFQDFSSRLFAGIAEAVEGVSAKKSVSEIEVAINGMGDDLRRFELTVLASPERLQAGRQLLVSEKVAALEKLLADEDGREPGRMQRLEPVMRPLLYRLSRLVDPGSDDRLEGLFGLRLAERGVFAADAATVNVVLPAPAVAYDEEPDPSAAAAVAGLLPGDVIEEVAGRRISGKEMAAAALLDTPAWGTPLELKVRRGVPQPYATHPRLDLFVSDSSPHPMKNFGCTICHQGQGSATSFKWASHAPNSPKIAHEWHAEYGWFNNHHWILPMLPDRFEQSSCLKCHHQVVDLESSEKFPEPPAPKLVEGYQLIRQYGCYGCHEINGWAGPDKRIGPDLRLAPNYHEVAAALSSDPGLADLGDDAVRWAREVRSSPDGREARGRLREAILEDAAAGDDSKLLSRSHELAAMLKDPETPGTFPKVGPSLRHLASKVGFDWLYSWLRNPQDFRPSTKMPRFFGLWEHLEGKGLEESQRYEPLEIRSMIHYLAASSQPFEFVQPFAGVTAEPDVARGKKAFQLRGCLACHQHGDFPDATSTHGPDLSRIGAKLASQPQGRAWLYSWIREPARYHSKTNMPNVLLEPERLADGRIADPAADATAYLMQSTEDWRPAEIPSESLADGEREALDELALMYLKERFPTVRAQAILKAGLTAEQGTMRGDEAMLVGLDGPARDATLLHYVGKKTIGKLACYSCHDIPGFEDAKPAGAALADWGRKESSRIAFEQVSQFVTHQLADAHGQGGHHGHAAESGHGDEEHGPGGHAADEAGLNPDLAYVVEEDHGAHIDLESLDPDTGYFVEKLLGHEREGFLWQKLRAPRSYDYKKVENKTYNERYRMPQFPFNAEQREAVMTFVLGLVAEPPAPQFVHQPGPREQARLDGIVVAEQYNCGGCHTLEMDRWDVAFRPGALGEGSETADYPFLSPHFTPQQVTGSLAADAEGLRRATLVGAPVLDPETGRPQLVDEDGVPIEEDDEESVPHRPFTLWRDALVDGEPRTVGGPNLIVPESAVAAGRQYPGRGGDLARLLYPVVIADEKQINPNVTPTDAWGWLPPPLVGEGKKVQSAWLHKFLLNPHMIRPPAVLRMPKFTWSAEQAAKMVDYFAAVDGADYPYVYDPRLDEGSVAAKESEHPGHLDGALKIVTNNNYCVKCHLVGDYAPPGNPKALAPQLERVHERLRPGYVHDWIANPKRFLPYTGMPVNIPYGAPVSQDLYAGTSEQQLDALTDLLMHFDLFAKRNLSLEAFLQEPAAPAEPAADAAAAGGQPADVTGAAAPAATDAAAIRSPAAAAAIE